MLLVKLVLVLIFGLCGGKMDMYETAGCRISAIVERSAVVSLGGESGGVGLVSLDKPRDDDKKRDEETTWAEIKGLFR